MFRNEHGRSFLNDAVRGAVDQCTSGYAGQQQVFLTKTCQCSELSPSVAVEKWRVLKPDCSRLMRTYSAIP